MIDIAPIVQQQPAFFGDPFNHSGKLHGPYRFLIQCDPGVTPSNETVTAVDEFGYALPLDATGVAGDSIVISNISVALAADKLIPDLWGVLFYVKNGSPKVYQIRCIADLNTTPATGSDQTCLLVCV